ncbi:hypothetical protein MBLNU457_5095t2 [Dothideomycetes sp. NU457]
MRAFVRLPATIRTGYTSPRPRLGLIAATPQYVRVVQRAFVNLPGQQEDESESKSDSKQSESALRSTLYKMFESSMTTLASVAVLGLVGYSYTVYYKRHVLQKMENAFNPGDPVLDMAEMGFGKVHPGDDETDRSHWIDRAEQKKLDEIIAGRVRGQYYLLVGEKGTGKSSMLIDAMAKIDGEGVAMFEAHADPEIFRVRLGKALDFEYHEDNIGALFSIRGPRDASALLDIERAFNKLEKVALRRRARVGRPLILIINSAHLIRDDENGRDLIELIQQRAEQWAASNLATIIMNSDDYWVYERLKGYGTRLHVMPVLDLPKDKAMIAMQNYRAKYFNEEADPEILAKVYDKVGGRLAFLNRVAKSHDMLQTCEHICRQEKTWFLNQCWILGESMDDDVMDQQKYASAAMVLAKALVDKEKDMESLYHPDKGHILPEVPLHEARQIMTRADFIKSYDSINVFTIDSNANVRADSVPMMNAFREICSQEGFEQFLNDTLDRISAIESLGRTRELTIKDLWNKGRYDITVSDKKGELQKMIGFEVQPQEEESDDDKSAKDKKDDDGKSDND